jgi:hypothetical protein
MFRSFEAETADGYVINQRGQTGGPRAISGPLTCLLI